jgi:HisA/HisF family protein
MMGFKLIPVIDLMHGQVVHAQRGLRDQYRPIQSSLCTSSDPIAIVRGLLDLFPFDTIYIADLDAILQGRPHHVVLRALCAAFPNIVWWLDAGFTDIPSIDPSNAKKIRPVCGTETFRFDHGSLPDGSILSLDHGADGPLGDAEWFTQARSWPSDLIAMTLSRVGAQAGPDLDLLRRLQARRPDVAIHAAGGVRTLEDLASAAQAGAKGALLATALHNGAISAAQLRAFGAGHSI